MEAQVLPVAFAHAVGVGLSLFALSVIARRVLALPAWAAMATGLAVLCIVGYVAFWAAFVSVSAILPIKFGFAAAIVALLAITIFRPQREDLELVAPCALVIVSAVVLTAWSLAGWTGDGSPLRFVAEQWHTPLPADNELPFLFAQQVRAADILTPFFGDWLTSDRPPLQTGLYLLLGMSGPDDRLGYQACAVALQMLAIAATWITARALGASQAWSVLAVVCVFFTPFALSNGSFVWPKMLASACTCAAVMVHFSALRNDRPLFAGGLAGVLAILGFLAHGSTAFMLIGLALGALLLRRTGSWRYIMCGVVCASALYAPWFAYQRFYDPPSDRLLKWHLADVIEIDDRSLGEALSDKYRSLTPAQWVDGRVRNIEALTTAPFTRAAESVSQPLAMRDATFALVPLSMGLFGLAFYALPLFAARKEERPYAVAILAFLAIWVVLMIQPGSTLTQYCSFFAQIGIIVMALRVFETNGRIAQMVGLGFAVVHCGLTWWLYALA